MELGRTGKSGSYMVEEIWQELAKARYSEWEQSASVRRHQQQELKYVYMNVAVHPLTWLLSKSCFFY